MARLSAFGMSKVFAFSMMALACATSFGVVSELGCATVDEASSSDTDASSARDSALVDPTEGGSLLDSASGTTPSCDKYCSLVMANCSGDHAQYASVDECLGFCAKLPLEQPTREAQEKESASVACRQYWADSPSRTSPETYCLAAGPFGGNVCGDRCTAFCTIVLATCSPDGGTPAFRTLPECASACANFSYRDAGSDGGGEGPDDPGAMDTLNCRLYQLRAAVEDPSPAACQKLKADGGVCAK